MSNSGNSIASKIQPFKTGLVENQTELSPKPKGAWVVNLRLY